MDDYEKQAKDFLKLCGASIKFKYCGLEIPPWGIAQHDVYDCTIRTRRGEMTVHFYDSVTGTDKRANGNVHCVTEYDVLSCLQKYDVGSMEDFFGEFYGKIESVDEFRRFERTYNAAVKEYEDVKRCFSEQEIEMLCEIN